MLKQSNTRKQGDVGTAYAVAYFAKNGCTVSIPLSDSQPYDLIVDQDKGVGLQRVQVKTSAHKDRSPNYRVELRTISNTRGKQLTIRKFDSSSCDILFIVTEDETMYRIPSQFMHGRGTITLTKDFDIWKVK